MKREPLILFLILGAVLYGVWTLLAPPKLETTRIEAATLRALEKNQQYLLGRPLDEQEKEEIRQGYIEDEVLLREALKRGLQWSDLRVRQRLTRIMRGALTETVADPSVAQLQAYFRDNLDRYTTPESSTLEQVFSLGARMSLTIDSWQSPCAAKSATMTLVSKTILTRSAGRHLHR